MKPIIAITIGDINGIGPEVVLKSLYDRKNFEGSIPLLFGPVDIWDDVSRELGLGLKFLPFRSVKDLSTKYINVFDIYFSPKINTGSISKESGYLSALSIFIAHQFCAKNICKALVTSPISKEALNSAGFPFHGHTEMLAELSKSKKYCMMLMGEGIRVGLVTTHSPINKVSKEITKIKILDKIDTINKSLKNDFKIKNPRIAVLGLNPHAGDGGVLGDEENRIIIPAILKAKQKKYNLAGPFAADGFFARYKLNDFDAVLAMYHDQGLIPLKMLAKGKGINFTAGLNIIRTSPDHGTAFDITGKNLAKPDSMIAALKLAIELAKRRK
jgi:4-hydroxythreonine-4-phosphate dehydrogenase